VFRRPIGEGAIAFAFIGGELPVSITERPFKHFNGFQNPAWRTRAIEHDRQVAGLGQRISLLPIPHRE
jgi:hypothetical protein